MTLELLIKVLANGLFFTPKALIRDFGGILTVFIYIVRVTVQLVLSVVHVKGYYIFVDQFDLFNMDAESRRVKFRCTIAHDFSMHATIEDIHISPSDETGSGGTGPRIQRNFIGNEQLVEIYCMSYCIDAFQVTVLLIVLMFIFASYGVQIAGGKLAKCNDNTITKRVLAQIMGVCDSL